MIEMTVDSVRINLATQQRVVILKIPELERYLFIWIAQPEAYAIAVELQGTLSPRPLTHDLLKNVISELGARIESIVISDLVDEVYYARIVLDMDGKHVEIDTRPSDAIALAVRAKTPIYVEDSILERAGVTLEQGEDRENIAHEIQSKTVRERLWLSLDERIIKTLDAMGVDKSQLFEELLQQHEPFLLAQSKLADEPDDAGELPLS
jgi:bifunctional DNase/RNase